MDSSDLPDEISLVFKGVDGAEAESFIGSVIRTARMEGKARDNDWIIDLVSSCMRGEALRWYIELDEDTQNDWKLLRKAILRQYPLGTQPLALSVRPTIPTPAAAATPPRPAPHNQSTGAPNAIYLIRLYFANAKSQFFLSADGHSSVRLTSTGAKALRVHWSPGNGLRMMENDLETLRTIWLIWFYPTFGGQSPTSETDFAQLVISDSLTKVPRPSVYSGDARTVSWTLDQDGWLQSYSYIKQTQYQHQFHTSKENFEAAVAEVCLPPGLGHWSVRDYQVFTLKLEPV